MPKKRVVPEPVKIEISIPDQIENLTKQLQACIGPMDILKAKILTSKIAELSKPIKPQVSQERLAELEKLRTSFTENKNKSHPKEKLREIEMHIATLTNAKIDPRQNLVDECLIHGQKLNVDRENAKRFCSICGETKSFQSHIFEMKKQDKDDSTSIGTDPALSHMQKFCSQFETGTGSPSLKVLEQMTIAYSKFHTTDPSKVQSSRTSQILKSKNTIPKFYYSADRLTKELRADSVPEFTSAEIGKLISQRAQLANVEEDDSKSKKSYHNMTYIRNLGLANNMAQARLFPHAKTNSTHKKRTRILEGQAIQQSKKQNMTRSVCWELKPFS